MTIKSARLQAGLTQQKMSKMFEIPVRTIQDWESGRRKPPVWAEKLIIEKLKRITKITKEIVETLIGKKWGELSPEMKEILLSKANAVSGFDSEPVFEGEAICDFRDTPISVSCEVSDGEVTIDDTAELYCSYSDIDDFYNE